MDVKEMSVPVPWGEIRLQIFGNAIHSKPLLGLPGYLDNSNTFRPLSEYLVKYGYYVISVDYPGHGFSSRLPLGFPLTPYTILMCIRRIVKFMNLKKFSFLTHSFGSMLSIMYSITYPNDVEKIVGLDSMIMVNLPDAKTEIPNYWATTIDEFIDSEKNEAKINYTSDELTKERAIEIIQRQLPYLSENEASILLERGLVVKNGKLEFSRDKRLRNHMTMSDIFVVTQLIKEHYNKPFLLIHSNLLFFHDHGSKIQNYLKSLLQSCDHKIDFQVIAFDEHHHFHVSQPNETAKLVVEFLNKNNSSSKL